MGALIALGSQPLKGNWALLVKDVKSKKNKEDHKKKPNLKKEKEKKNLEEKKTNKK